MNRFVRLLTLFGALVLAAMATPLVYWWTDALRGDWSDGRGETLVVLAGDLLTEEEKDRPAVLGHGTQIRCVYAAWAWREHQYARVIASGGKGAAAAMKTYLIALGIPAERIVLETSAESTRDNALRVKDMLGPDAGAVVLLSSDYHMRRAAASFRRVGLDVKPLPCPDIAKRANGAYFWRWEACRLLTTETARFLYYSIQGWT